MPSRNVLKVDISDSYYHIYARGASRQDIFLDEEDFLYFQQLNRRYLSRREMKNAAGLPYAKLYDQIEVLCFAQMNNHFHMLIYQKELGAMTRLMRGVMTAYTMYFNKRYDKTGPLFENTYKASRIDNDSYLLHISRYIHLNPKEWRKYPYSSIRAYLDEEYIDWIMTQKIQLLFSSKKEYGIFTSDFEDEMRSRELIRWQLANRIGE